MIPPKCDKSRRREYVCLHYKLQAAYRKKHPYTPFGRIRKHIERRWQIVCYNKRNVEGSESPKRISNVKWSDTIESVRLF